MKSLVVLFVLSLSISFSNLFAQDEQIRGDVSLYLLVNYDDALFDLDYDVIANPQRALPLIRRAKFHSMHGETNQAMQDIRLAYQISPFMVDLYYNRGPHNVVNLLSLNPEQTMVGNDFIKRLEYLEWEIFLAYAKQEIDDSHLKTLEESIVKMKQKDFFGAEDILISAEKTKDKNLRSHLLALIAIERLEFDKAISILEEIITVDKANAMAYYLLSLVYTEKSMYQEAKSMLNQSIYHNANFSKAYFDRASLNKKMGAIDEAIEDYDKVIYLAEDYFDEAVLNRGLTYSMVGDYNKALVDIEKAMKIDPNNLELLENRANIYMIQGKIDQALLDYNAIIEKENTPENLYNRALAYFLQYDLEKGCADIEKSAATGYEPAEKRRIDFCTERY